MSAPVAHPAALHRRDSAVAADAAPRRGRGRPPEGGDCRLPPSGSCRRRGVRARARARGAGAVCAYYGIFAGLMVGYAHARARGDASSLDVRGVLDGDRGGGRRRRSRSCSPSSCRSCACRRRAGSRGRVEDTARCAGRRARLPRVVDARARMAARRRAALRPVGAKCSSRACFARRCSAGRRRHRGCARRARDRETALLYGIARACSPSGRRSVPAPGCIASSITCRRSRSSAPRRGSASSSCSAWRCSPRSRCAHCFDALPAAAPRARRRPSRWPPAIADLADLSAQVVSTRPTCRRRYARARAQPARPARGVPVLRRAHRVPAARAVHAVLDLALDADGQRLQRRHSGRLPRGRARSSTRSRRTTRSRCSRAGACATSRSTGTCIAGREDEIRRAAGARTPQPADAGGDERMTLYEVVDIRRMLSDSRCYSEVGIGSWTCAFARRPSSSAGAFFLTGAFFLVVAAPASSRWPASIAAGRGCAAPSP